MLASLPTSICYLWEEILNGLQIIFIIKNILKVVLENGEDGEGGGGVLQPSNTQHHPILDVPNWIGYYRTNEIWSIEISHIHHAL